MSEVELPKAQEILRRAVHLDRVEQSSPAMTAEALEAAAAELGLQPTAVAMALAEARAGGAPPARRMERVVGPRTVTVVRSCDVAADDAARLVGEWLERGHLLRVTQGAEGSVVGRRRSDPAATAARAVRSIHGEGGLSKVREVRAGVGVVADGSTAVCVQADVGDSRTSAVATGSVLGTLGLAAVGLGAVAVSPFLALVAPVAVVGGVAAARQTHRDTVRKVSRALEETSNAVAQGSPPPSAMAGLGRAVRRIGRR